MDYGGISGLIDIRDKLQRRADGGPNRRVALGDKRGVVVHYSGPPVDLSRPVLDVLQSEALYHVRKVWAWTYDGKPLYGDGLMYHLSIGPAGEKLLCRDFERVLWHCGAWPENADALAVHVPIGGDQHATAAQRRALAEVCDQWIAAGHGGRADVKGHQELSPTSCPGTLMGDFVYQYREGVTVMANGQWFPETGHYVGGGFWTYWSTRGGLAIFGYPLTDERSERCEDGKVRTVQYFERAVFEYWPENEPAYQVLLRRLGAEALARVG